MKITHSNLDVKNKSFIVPEELGGKVVFDEKGIADVEQATAQYLLSVGFTTLSKIKEVTEAPADTETQSEDSNTGKKKK
jgi:hypothetical protein